MAFDQQPVIFAPDGDNMPPGGDAIIKPTFDRFFQLKGPDVERIEQALALRRLRSFGLGQQR